MADQSQGAGTAQGTGSPYSFEASSDDEAQSRRPFYRSPLFLFTVAVPFLLSVLYFGVFASDVYISESRFVVRSPDRKTASPLGEILSAGGFSGASEESNAVIEFVEARDALAAIDGDGLVENAYGSDKVSWFDRFGTLVRGTSREQLYQYYLSKITIENDPLLQVTNLTVRAYTPQDAQEINRRLLKQSEELVNRLANRARNDAISVAAGEVEEAKNRARTAAVELARFRNSKGIIDPELEAEVRLQMVSKLQDELIATRTQLAQLQTYTPQASQIPFLRTRIASIEREITEKSGSIAGGPGSLSATATQYQELKLASELAEKQLAIVLASYEEAKAEARRKRAYVERIAEPSLPDYAAEPRRMRGILATLILGLVLWGVLSTLLAGVREHRD